MISFITMCILCMSLHINCIQWALTLRLRLSCCIPLESGGMYRLSLFPSLIVTFYKILLRGICTPHVYFLPCFSARRQCLIFIGIKLNYSKSTTLCSTTSIQNPTNPAHESSIKVKTFLNVLKCLFLIKIILQKINSIKKTFLEFNFDSSLPGIFHDDGLESLQCC